MGMETEWERLLRAAKVFVGCWTDSSFATMVGYTPQACGLEELLAWAVATDRATSKTITREKKGEGAAVLYILGKNRRPCQNPHHLL